MPNLVDLFNQVSVFAKLTVLVALFAFGLAVAYVFRPTEQRLALMRPVSLAAIFATISGLFGGWVALLQSVPATISGHELTEVLSRGLGESLIVGFVSFGLLAAGWMLVAVGVVRRQTAS